MSLKPSAQARFLSQLVIADGFVHGWAFDPLRPVLGVALTVDGLESASGLTGHAVADTYYAGAVPPNPHCGFSLPLPRNALDGLTHKIAVKVADWQALPSAPKAELDWFDGACFGEVSLNPQGYFDGWVGFRYSLTNNKIPPVLVSQDQDVRFAITLKPEPAKAVDGSLALCKFRVEQGRFADIASPVFSCLGRELRFRKSAVSWKVAGKLDKVDFEGIRGWIYNAANPAESLDLVLLVDDQPHSVIRPNMQRRDIARQLKLLPEEIGLCGFDVSLPALLKDGRPHTVAVRCKVDGTLLKGSPLHYQHKRAGMELGEALRLGGSPTSGGLASPASKSSVDSPAFPAATSRGALKRKPRQPPQVSVIILNRNGAPCLDNLFSSFLQHNTVPCELIVIDHASSDGSLDVIRRWEQQLPLRVEALDQNFSFSASCNRGARLAKAPALLFLNNDIVWLQDILPAMLETLKSPKVGIVGLRLLKTEFAKDSGNLAQNANPEVQHLGVRFTLVDEQYWPYEVTPQTAKLDAQYSPQQLPVVTGAVMLCRRNQFLKAGGFDEAYFYGYEDVELCLRMGRQNGFSVMCRNDLVALHHHGYTRLTGREPMVDHHLNNQKRLADKLGLWIKQHFWQSLLAGDGLITSETFTVGFAVAACHGLSADKKQLAAALELATSLVALYPHCRTLFLTSDQDWDHVGECHALVVLSPDYDLRAIKQARSDLRTALYVYDASSVARWNSNPGLALFDLCLHGNDNAVKKALKDLDAGVATEAVARDAPLGTLLAADRLRVVLAAPAFASAVPLVPTQERGNGNGVGYRNKKEGNNAASLLTAALKSQGASVHSRDMNKSGRSDASPRVAEAIITLFDPALIDQDNHFRFERRDDVINVLWIVGAADNLRPQDIAQADEVWLGAGKLPAHLVKAARVQRSVGLKPKAMQGLVKQLQKSVDEKIGRSFHTS